MSVRTCINCGRNVFYYSDPNDYFYRSDINYCSKCCEEEHECKCVDTRPPDYNTYYGNQDFIGTK